MTTKFFKTTISVEIYTLNKPASYDEAFWSHLIDALREEEGTLDAGTSLEEAEITRTEVQAQVEDLDERLADLIGPEVTCAFCGQLTPQRTAHRHDGPGWVGDDCCWDERLRS